MDLYPDVTNFLFPREDTVTDLVSLRRRDGRMGSEERVLSGHQDPTRPSPCKSVGNPNYALEEPVEKHSTSLPNYLGDPEMLVQGNREEELKKSIFLKS